MELYQINYRQKLLIILKINPMKKILFFTFLISFNFINAQVTCETPKTKIILTGDSWADFPFGFGTISGNLDRYGFTNVKMYSSSALSVSGIETANMLQPSYITNLQNELIAHPDVEIVIVSIGGNDMLNNWNTSMDSLQTDSLITDVFIRIDSIISKIKGLKTNLQIFLPGYDYGNFGEVINTFSVPSLHPFYSKWSSMGNPNFLELNSLMNIVSKRFKALGLKYQITYNDASGLMQYVYGQQNPLGVSPGGTYAPRSVTVPGGNLNYPSPKVAIRDYGPFRDCFHLSAEGFDHFYSYHFKNYFWKYLRQNVDTTFYSEGNNKDGGVSLSSVINNEISIGDTPATSTIFKGIVSFNTSSIPNSSVIQNSNLYIYRSNLSGSLPVFDKVILEIKKGNFGTTSSVEIADYSSVSDAKDTACVYGTVAKNGYWLRIKLPNSVQAEINKLGVTQFKISMLDTTNGSVLHFSTGDSTNKPMLDIEYYNPTSLEKNNLENLITIFPNPIDGNVLNIRGVNDGETQISVVDLMGRKMQINLISNQKIDVSYFKKGVYFILFENENKRLSKRFIKL